MNIVNSVLLVDDNPFDVDVAKRILELTGRYKHVYSVTNGAEALELFRDYESSRRDYPDKFPPLVILLDINMPVMDGFGFLQSYAELDQTDEQPPFVVVMLTSSSYDADRERAFTSPFVKEYIVKPMTLKRAVELADQLGAPDE